MKDNFSSSGPARLYAVAALVGLSGAILSALGVFDRSARTSQAAAIVNGEGITRAEYVRALTAMQESLRRPLNADDKKRALDLLINEELLLQQSLDLGLPREDIALRKLLIQSVVKIAALDERESLPTEDDLRALFEKERKLFSPASTVTINIAAANTSEMALTFQRLLADGETFKDAAHQAGLETPNIPPDLPIAKIADYVGGDIRDALITMAVGDIAGPFPSVGRERFVWLKSQTGAAIEFAAVKDQVAAEWRRRREEKAFDSYIARLRSGAAIQISDSLPDPSS